MKAICQSLVAYRPYLVALVVVMLWASSFPAIKLALHGYQPLELTLLRLLIAAMTLGLLVLGSLLRHKTHHSHQHQ